MTLVKLKSSSPKRNVSKLLRELPDDCSYEDIQYHLYVLQKIENANLDIKNGRVVSHEGAKKRFKKWLKR